MITSRRAFITGLVSFVAAPAIVRVSSIMPVKTIGFDLSVPFVDYNTIYGLDNIPAKVDFATLMQQIGESFNLPKEFYNV